MKKFLNICSYVLNIILLGCVLYLGYSSKLQKSSQKETIKKESHEKLSVSRSSEKIESRAQTLPPVKKIYESDNVEVVNAEQMLHDCDKNAIVAKDKYLNRWFDIKGRIRYIESDASSFEIIAQLWEHAGMRIIFKIPEQKREVIREKLYTINEGESVVVRGKVIEVENSHCVVSVYDLFKESDYKSENYSSGSYTSTAQSAEDYIDLELPSGTLWKSTSEGGLYDYGSALNHFKNRLPSYEQFVELKDNCLWLWSGNGYYVYGKNNKHIFIKAAGWRDENGNITLVGTDGGYWTNTVKDYEKAWYLNFTKSKVRMLNYNRSIGLSVHLVK